MGPQPPPFTYDEEMARQDQVLNNLTIIQAQAQLLMRRIDAHRKLDHDDVYQRLVVVVEAVRHLTELHRATRKSTPAQPEEPD